MGNTRLDHGTTTTFPESGDVRLTFYPTRCFVYCLCGGINLEVGMGYAGTGININFVFYHY